MAKVLYNIPRV